MPPLAQRPNFSPPAWRWRCAVASWLSARASARKVGSPDLHQARMRFVVLAGCLAYGIPIGIFDPPWTEMHARVYMLDALIFGAFALYTFRRFSLNPAPNSVLRTIGLFADHAAAVGCLAVTDRDAAALAWLPLFIIQGVGIRFGVRWLFASQAIGLVGVLIVCTSNQYFRANGTFVLGAFLSVLVIPLYFALLASREARIKDALNRARVEAEAANEAKGRFVAMISHELRTPLTAICGLNELLRSEALPGQSQRLLAEQHAAGTLMLAMVNDVLDLSKVEDGQMHVQESAFDPQELALSVLQALSFQAKQKGLLLHVELDADIPASLTGSPFHVTRILQNLLGNAIKFTLQGSITLRVSRDRAAARSAGPLVVQFDVCDTGIGIPPTALPRIFERFYQVDDTVTRRFGGTGLGTSLAKEFCERLNGTVQVESQLGEGTQFTVRIPFAEPPMARDPTPSATPAATLVAFTDERPLHPEIAVQAALVGAALKPVSLQLPPGEASLLVAEPGAVVFLVDPPTEKSQAVLDAVERDDFSIIQLSAVNPWKASRTPRHSGRIVFCTRPEEIGQAIRLALLGKQEIPRAAPSPVPISALNMVANADRPSVLLAEDTPTVQLVMQVTLEKAGFSVVVADDGAEALRAASARPFDVVLLDWNMPGVDGIGVIRRLRAEPGPNRTTPIVVATAAPSRQLIEEALSAGAQAVVGKPFETEELVRAIEEALERAGPRPPPPAAAGAPAAPAAAEVPVPKLLDLDSLDGPKSIFKLIDPTRLLRTFIRDAEQHAALLKRAAEAGDFSQFRASVHSMTGYAGTLGASRLAWLLKTAPRDESELRSAGSSAADELCSALHATCQALTDYSANLTCAVH